MKKEDHEIFIQGDNFSVQERLKKIKKEQAEQSGNEADDFFHEHEPQKAKGNHGWSAPYNEWY